ncbi:MAG: prepilin-type N-terminal cleavage/methylation domain-containing protein [Verrucomicrobiales bacterium]|nr:prepilin-type N-terminal cleavage/methylation domain-containing protein [Verrucomicrobiales bacterium]
MRLPTPIRTPRFPRGFTVLELMLSVAIMTVIVIGLYTVFDATQRALRTTVAQVDTLEGVRAASDLLVRDLEAATPVRVSNTNWTSFSATLNPFGVPVDLEGLVKTDGVLFRTSIQDIFFLTRQNDTWTAIGYWVGPANTNLVGQPINYGRLYRFSYETNGAAFAYTNLFARFNSPARIRDSQLVMDGVVHLRTVAYDYDGKPLLAGMFTNTPVSLHPWYADPVRNTETAYWFRRVNVPSFPTSIELELGVLEPQVVTRAASLPNANTARDYLARQAGSVHFFRHRIPLRNAPPF